MPNLSTSPELVSPKENSLFIAAIIVSVVGWLLLTAMTFGGVWFLVAILAVIVWFSNGLLTAGLRAEAVEVHPEQVGRLDAAFREVCARLGVAKPPRLYVIESGGALNAFATRHAGRHFVVVYSDMLEALGPDSAEMQFLLGHELGHIHRNHVLWGLLLAPAMFLPILGPAYSRACESTCDRYGAAAAQDPLAAMRAIMVLAGGKETGREMDVAHFARQNRSERGFFVSWYELISGYPTLTRRMGDLGALAGQATLRTPPRHPLSYLFALVTFGGGFGGRSIMSTLLLIYIVGILAALALPAVSDALKRGKDTQTMLNARRIYFAERQMLIDRSITGDRGVGWPADTGVTSSAQFRDLLIKDGYFPADELAKMKFDQFQIGNVSVFDPDDTIILRTADVVCYKGGNVKILRRGEEPEGHDPPRSPPYLAP